MTSHLLDKRVQIVKLIRFSDRLNILAEVGVDALELFEDFFVGHC